MFHKERRLEPAVTGETACPTKRVFLDDYKSTFFL
jgi:hypothetical protein